MTKKYRALALLLTVSGMVYGQAASNFSADTDYEFKTEGDGAGRTIVITNYRGTSTSISIPDTLGSIPVLRIENGAFRRKNLTSITGFPPLMGEYSFADNRLTDVTIPGSIRTVSAGAFSNNRITRLTIEEGVYFIGESAFRGNGLHEIVLPDSVIGVADNAFAGNPLTAITLGRNVEFARSAVDSDFTGFYLNSGSQAGTYVYRDGRWINQDAEDSDYYEGFPLETDWEGYVPELYSKGDQVFIISFGVIFPTVFFNNGSVIDHNFDPPVGGSGSLGYSYFLGPHFYLGGEIGIKFNYTMGQNTIFLIPIGLRTGWQFLYRRFEFPLNLTVGIAPQRYLNLGYAGLFVKGGASAFYRFNPDWSFGLNCDWNWYPQWPKDEGKRVPSKDMYGNIIGLTISARYHF
ncbi:MAG: leucine-rich repeat domain-containing protein [Treponema sp.]|nr:leucine-rich repeat domain-containing protein [Treponema sp.]